MKVCVIGCWYRDDIYSHHLKTLMDAGKRHNNVDLDLVTSNCNCFSSSQKYSITEEELLDRNCSAIKIPFAPADPTKKYGKLKYYLVKGLKLNFILEPLRGITFFMRARKCPVVHFDQVLKSFGVLSFLVLLAISKLFGKKVVVTVHELDPLQEKYISLNRYYNWADRIIVFSSTFKEQLVKAGMKMEKIEVVPYGVALEPLNGSFKRDRFIFFGGHKLLNGKGFNTLIETLDILRAKGKKSSVLIYTGEGCIGLEEGKKLVKDMHLDEYVKWSDFLSGAKMAEAYQKSIACLVPFTGGSGRYPATAAMANATPVIATRKADLPEYLGDAGIYIGESSAEELSEAMINLMNNPDMARAFGEKGRKRAEEHFSAELISQRIFQIYAEIQ